jgi:hypothetical protein
MYMNKTMSFGYAMAIRQYTTITDVIAKTLKYSGTGTSVIEDVTNNQLLSIKSANNRLTVVEGTGPDVGTILLDCNVDLTSSAGTGELFFSPDSSAPNYKFRRLVAGAGMQIINSEPDALEIACLVPQAGTVTLDSSSDTGTSLVGIDSLGLDLKVRSLVSLNPNMIIGEDATGKEVEFTRVVTQHVTPTDILSTGPFGLAGDARLSIACKDLYPTEWATDLLPLRVPAMYWHGTLVDAAVVPPITLSTTGYFNTMIAGLPSNVPFTMFATVVCNTPFHLTFVFNQMAGGSAKKWNAFLSSSTATTANTMMRIPMTLQPATPNGVLFSTERTPRPILDVETTSPEGLCATVTQCVTGIYPAGGTDVWILGFDFVFGGIQPLNVLPSQSEPPIQCVPWG